MEQEEFLEKLEVELKISKNSEHTIKNYVRANKDLLNFLKKEPENVTEDDVKTHAGEYVTKFKISARVIFKSHLPKTRVGKIMKKELRKEMEKLIEKGT